MVTSDSSQFTYLFFIVFGISFVGSLIEGWLYNSLSAWYFASGISIFARKGTYQKGVNIHELAEKLMSFQAGGRIRLIPNVISENKILLREIVDRTGFTLGRRNRNVLLMMSSITLDTLQSRVEFVGRLRWHFILAFPVLVYLIYLFLNNTGLSFPFAIVMVALIVGSAIFSYRKQAKVYKDICSFLDRELEVISQNHLE